MVEARRRELLGVVLVALGVFLALSLVPPGWLGAAAGAASGNLMGALGRLVSEWAVRLLGPGIVLAAALPWIGGAACLGWIGRQAAVRWAVFLAGVALLGPTALAVAGGTGGEGAAWFGPADRVGWLGRALSVPFLVLVGRFGGLVWLGFLFVALSVATIGWNPVRAGARALGRGARAGWRALGRARARGSARRRPSGAARAGAAAGAAVAAGAVVDRTEEEVAGPPEEAGAAFRAEPAGRAGDAAPAGALNRKSVV